MTTDFDELTGGVAPLTSQEKKKKFGLELKDILAGCAFPFMLMLILSGTVMMFIGYNLELGMQILVLVVGEVLTLVALFIFGRQNGVSAYKKTVNQATKRKNNSSDIRARLRVGEYKVWKGVLIGGLICVPYMIFQLVYCIVPNDVCRFALMYVFGWAYYPLSFAGASQWLNFIWIIPVVGVHTAAYVFGAGKEKKRQEIIAAAEEKKAERANRNKK